MSEHKTIVLVDKFGDLWTLDFMFTPCGVEYLCEGDGKFINNIFNCYAFIEGMGMEELGEL
jgi:hypothetical protein